MTPFGAMADTETLRRHARRGQRASAATCRALYRISGETFTIDEAVDRTGVERKSLQAKISRLRRLDRPVTWEALAT